MTHYRNTAFILQNGLYCCNCGVQDPAYINIGHKSLIENRGQSPVLQSPGGVLNDYIPFYFHYKMPMLYHIFNGIVKEYSGTQNEIIYLISYVEKIIEMQIPFLFTDRHAYLAHKTIYTKYEELEKLRWDIMKDDTWHKEYSDQKKELKQSEFLIHQHLPLTGILGIVAQNEEIATFVRKEISLADLSLQIVVKPEYYYA